MADNQICVYAPEKLKERIAAAAHAANLSVSKFLITCFEIVEEEHKEKESRNA